CGTRSSACSPSRIDQPRFTLLHLAVTTVKSCRGEPGPRVGTMHGLDLASRRPAMPWPAVEVRHRRSVFVSSAGHASVSAIVRLTYRLSRVFERGPIANPQT